MQPGARGRLHILVRELQTALRQRQARIELLARPNLRSAHRTQQERALASIRARVMALREAIRMELRRLRGGYQAPPRTRRDPVGEFLASAEWRGLLEEGGDYIDVDGIIRYIHERIDSIVAMESADRIEQSIVQAPDLINRFRLLVQAYLQGENIEQFGFLPDLHPDDREAQFRTWNAPAFRTWEYDFRGLEGRARNELHQAMLTRLFMTLPYLPASPYAPANYYMFQVVFSTGEEVRWRNIILQPDRLVSLLNMLLTFGTTGEAMDISTGEIGGSDTVEEIMNITRLYRVRLFPYSQEMAARGWGDPSGLFDHSQNEPIRPHIPLRRRRVGFFPWFNRTDIDLSRYLIAFGPDDFLQRREIFSRNCLLYALELTGLFTESELESMSIFCHTRRLSFKIIRELAQKFNITFDISQRDKKGRRRKVTIGKGTRQVSVGIIYDHAFLVEKVPVTSYYLREPTRIQAWLESGDHDPVRAKQIRGFRPDGRPLFAGEDRYMTSFGVIEWLIDAHFKEVGPEELDSSFLQAVRMSDVVSLEISLHRCVRSTPALLGDLQYDPALCLKKFEPDTPKPVSFKAARAMIGNRPKIKTFYADFEAFTVDDEGRPLESHEPFMCCCCDDETDDVWMFFKEGCEQLFLDFVLKHTPTDTAPLVYYHNLGYDLNFLARYGISACLPRGRRVLSAEITYHDRVITFKDSLSLIPAPLKAFGNMFHLPIEKEVFPYDYYTAHRLYEVETPPLSEVLEWMGDRWTEEDKAHLVEKAKELGDGETFPMARYARYYCSRDVEVLKAGMKVFARGIRENFGLEASDYLSVSSIANAIFNKQIYAANPNLYKVGGIVRVFLQQAIHGGRVMPAENKKWYYKAEEGGGLVDFDAVSLYPSAMSRLWLVEGEPHVLSEEDILFFEERRHTFSAYVVEIEIVKIGKPRKFPLVIGRDETTGSVLNTNEPPVWMTVCDIELEDLIEFQEIEYVPIRGYYWTGARRTEIQSCIREIFEKRVQYKKEHNPLEAVYKLIMNSVYGKTILKPVKSKMIYLCKDSPKYQEMVFKDSHDIDYIEPIIGSNIMALKVGNPIDKHFNFSLFGIHILAMSKRIMNEVMCLAEDLGMQIYYQDTDSMHIEQTALTALADAFEEKYGRSLIGSSPGQFHSDFNLFPDSTNVRATESFFVGKKCYLDCLLDDQGRTGYHVRLKGVPRAAIDDAARSGFEGSLPALYRALCRGESVTFDLLAGDRVAFEYSRGMTIHSKNRFVRRVAFNRAPPPDNL